MSIDSGAMCGCGATPTDELLEAMKDSGLGFDLAIMAFIIISPANFKLGLVQG